ncbi:MAG: hypothetical protein IKP22_05980 [Clostridia bacterium]|nr:hypothetical protein [Clostridia bacterium]
MKPTVDTGSEKDCMLCQIKTKEDAFALFAKMGMDFTVQERLECHDSLTKIYANSVNTFRVITYRWKEAILWTPPVLRIRKGGSHLDNAHAGGIFVAVDDDGKLHDTVYTEFKETYKQHPDTKTEFKNYRIDLFP